MNAESLRPKLELYLPTGNKADSDSLSAYFQAQNAIDQFLKTEITPNDLVEILGDVGKVDIDDWLDCVHHNLREG